MDEVRYRKMIKALTKKVLLTGILLLFCGCWLCGFLFVFNKEIENKLLIYAFFFVFPTIFTIRSISLYYKTLKKRFYLYNLGTSVTGSISSVYSYRQRYTVSYIYLIDNKRFYGNDVFENSSFFKINGDFIVAENDKVSVYYNPDQPDESMLFFPQTEYVMVRSGYSAAK